MSVSTDTGITTAMRRLLRLGGSAARGSFATVAGEQLHYLEEGTGPAVVLIHGGTGGGANWFRLLHPLSQDFRVLAPDLPGFGLSPARRPAARLGTVAAQLLEEWLRVMDVRHAIVVATSFGGIAALRLAQHAPDRVARLFLLDAAGLGHWLHPLLRLALLPVLGTYWVRPTREGTARTFRLLLTRNRSSLTVEMQDALIDFLYVTARSAGTPYLLETLRLFAGPTGQREILRPDELRAIVQPTTIALGQHDRFFSRRAARHAARTMPNARFELIHGAGHSPNWEKPTAVLASILSLVAR